MLLRIVTAIVALTGYPAFAWWVGTRYDRKALVILWLLVSAGVGVLLFNSVRHLSAARNSVFWYMPAMPVLSYGLATRSVAKSIEEHLEPPTIIPAGATVRAIGAHLLGLLIATIPAVLQDVMRIVRG